MQTESCTDGEREGGKVQRGQGERGQRRIESKRGGRESQGGVEGGGMSETCDMWTETCINR